MATEGIGPKQRGTAGISDKLLDKAHKAAETMKAQKATENENAEPVKFAGRSMKTTNVGPRLNTAQAPKSTDTKGGPSIKDHTVEHHEQGHPDQGKIQP